jgi:hypothetical protein
MSLIVFRVYLPATACTHESSKASQTPQQCMDARTLESRVHEATDDQEASFCPWYIDASSQTRGRTIISIDLRSQRLNRRYPEVQNRTNERRKIASTRQTMHVYGGRAAWIDETCLHSVGANQHPEQLPPTGSSSLGPRGQVISSRPPTTTYFPRSRRHTARAMREGYLRLHSAPLANGSRFLGPCLLDPKGHDA